MNAKKSLVLFCLSVFLLQNGFAQEVLRFSLEEAVKYALENNINVKNAQLEHQASDNEIGEILSIGLPQVNASAGLTDNVILPKTIIDISSFPGSTVPEGTTEEVTFATQYSAFMDITVEQMVFDASYFIGLKAAKTLKELTYRDLELSRIDASEMVTKAYYTALINSERLELFNRQLGTTDTLLQETRIMNENGFAEKIDVSRIQVQYNNLKVEKNRFERLSDLSLDLLKFQMGIPISQPIELTENLESITFTETTYDLATFDYSNRLEFSQIQTREKLQEINVKNIRTGYYPNLHAFASLGANSGSQNFGRATSLDFGGTNRAWFESAAIGLNLNIPIFDSFKKSNQIQKVQVKLEQIDNQREQLKSNIDLEILQARNDLNTAGENLDIQKENLELAKEIYDVSKIKYQEGVGSNIEVINATTTYKESEINYYNALYDALIAKVDLEKALGTLID